MMNLRRISYNQFGTLASSWAARYPKDSRVEVHYKPDEPQVAVLEPGFGWVTYGWFAAEGAPVVRAPRPG